MMATKTCVLIPVENVPEKIELFRKEHIHHPGRDIPLHTTMLYDFYDFEQCTEQVIHRLSSVAAQQKPFDYYANPLCAFPTVQALWLSPSPQSMFEKITDALYQEFPQFKPGRWKGYPLYHMTLTLGGEDSAGEQFTQQFLDEFQDILPIRCLADRLSIYGEVQGCWKHLFSAPFKNNTPVND